MNKIEKIIFMSKVIQQWYAHFFRNMFIIKKQPVHILFCTCDHYEPGTGKVSTEIELKRVEELLKKYPFIANKHKDYHGNIPKRTWFFPPHYHRNYNLKNLVSLCEQGYGEIELHLHHGKNRPDTSANLRKTILQCKDEYSKLGIFGELNGRKMYGFIHGDWALDNSRNGEFCGVNNELTILNETGCYADFTHPSPFKETNPSQINSIFYAIDDADRPKSYNRGNEVENRAKQKGDLMIFQGPLYPIFLSKRIWSLRAMGDVINGNPPVTPKRIDAWVKTNICVKGANEFIFIKTHTHGATDSKAVLGKEMEDIFKYLETKYNDGENFILHYVTSREMYNIVKAIETKGQIENPEDYRNYLISKPKYDSSIDIAKASDVLKNFVSETYSG